MLLNFDVKLNQCIWIDTPIFLPNVCVFSISHVLYPIYGSPTKMLSDSLLFLTDLWLCSYKFKWMISGISCSTNLSKEQHHSSKRPRNLQCNIIVVVAVTGLGKNYINAIAIYQLCEWNVAWEYLFWLTALYELIFNWF